MAFADLIGAAIGVMLLVIVAYLLVGSTISTAEIVTNAQKAAALQDQVQLRTGFTISDVNVDQSTINCTVKNTGSEIISDFTHVDFIVFDRNTSAGYITYTYNSGISPGTWTIIDKGGEVIHLSELDPGESYKFQVTTLGTDPTWFQITTGNGVYESILIRG